MSGHVDTGNIKRRLEILFGIAITVAAVFFMVSALRGFDPESIFRAKINWCLAVLSVLILAFSTLIRAFVYPYGIDREMRVMEAWQIVAIGNAANMILPFRAGEALRLALFPKRYGAGRRALLVIIPGFADTGVILFLCLMAVAVANFKTPTYLLILKVLTYGFLAICALILFILLVVPKSRAFVLSCLNRDTLEMFLWVALSWFAVLLSIWVGFIAFGYPPIRAISLAFATFAGINLAGMIPSSPGSIGLFEWSVSVGLTDLGVADIPAKMAGFLLHIFQYGAALPIGLVLYLRFFLSRRRTRPRVIITRWQKPARP